MRQHVTIDRTQDVTNAQQDVAQKAAFDFLNSSHTSKEKNAMKFEFNVENENDDEKVRRENANANYAI